MTTMALAVGTVACRSRGGIQGVVAVAAATRCRSGPAVSTMGRGNDAVICACRILRRVLEFLARAHGWAPDPAQVRRCPGGLEHGGALLPGDAPGGLCLCPFRDGLAG